VFSSWYQNITWYCAEKNHNRKIKHDIQASQSPRLDRRWVFDVFRDIYRQSRPAYIRYTHEIVDLSILNKKASEQNKEIERRVEMIALICYKPLEITIFQKLIFPTINLKMDPSARFSFVLCLGTVSNQISNIIPHHVDIILTYIAPMWLN